MINKSSRGVLNDVLSMRHNIRQRMADRPQTPEVVADFHKGYNFEQELRDHRKSGLVGLARRVEAGPKKIERAKRIQELKEKRRAGKR